MRGDELAECVALWTEIKTEIKRHLAHLSSPVAWQIRTGPKGRWVIEDDDLAFDPAFRAKMEKAGAKFRPLYLAPAPSPPASGSADDFPKPRRRDGQSPCGECHLPAGEVCNICGASHPATPDADPVQMGREAAQQHYARSSSVIATEISDGQHDDYLYVAGAIAGARLACDRGRAAWAGEIKRLTRERDEAQREAVSLATTIHRLYFREITSWRPLDDPAGVISQIDNMIAGIMSRLTAAEAQVSALRAENERLREGLRPFAKIRTADHSDDATVPVEIDFTREEAEALNADIDAGRIPFAKKAGTDPYAADAGMNWPRHSLSIDTLQLKHFRRARTLLKTDKTETTGGPDHG